MKKYILALTLMLPFINVNAYDEDHIDCTPIQMETGREALKDISFNLTYADDYIDMNGDFEESFMELTFPNLPEGYKVEITGNGLSYGISKSTYRAFVKGGVYDIVYKNWYCDDTIRAYQIRVPHYKEFCTGSTCKEGVFFDGTYENLASNYKPDEENVSTALIIILASLVLVIVVALVIIIRARRRRKKYEGIM